MLDSPEAAHGRSFQVQSLLAHPFLHATLFIASFHVLVCTSRVCVHQMDATPLAVIGTVPLGRFMIITVVVITPTMNNNAIRIC